MLTATLRTWAEMIKLAHSVFALPFAYLGMLLAAGGWPPGRTVLWVTLAMVGARNAGMAFNRVLDREMISLFVEGTMNVLKHHGIVAGPKALG